MSSRPAIALGESRYSGIGQARTNRGHDVFRRNLARRAFEALFDFGGQKLALFFRRKLFESRQAGRGGAAKEVMLFRLFVLMDVRYIKTAPQIRGGWPVPVPVIPLACRAAIAGSPSGSYKPGAFTRKS